MAKQVKKTPGESQEYIKIKILLPVSGKFLLPYNVGQVVELPKNQAEEMVEVKYAEFVK